MDWSSAPLRLASLLAAFLVGGGAGVAVATRGDGSGLAGGVLGESAHSEADGPRIGEPAAVDAVAPGGVVGLAASCAPQADWGTLRAELASRVIALVNAHRASRGLGPLAASPTLAASAEWKSLHMASSRYFSHSDPAPPVARSFPERVAGCGYSAGGAGENIAYGYSTPDAVMTGWLNSPGHRANIENATYRAIGVGVASRAGGPLYWTQNFGTVADGRAQPSGSSPPARPGTAGRGAPRAAGLAVASFAASTPWRGSVSATVRVRRGGSGVTRGAVACAAQIGGQRLRVIASAFRGGRAVCAWRVPGAATGKVVNGSIGVRAGGRAIRRAFAVQAA